MSLKKLAALALALVMILAAMTTGAMAANEKYDADDLDFEEIIEDTEAADEFKVFHWWTAGGEKDAIESVINHFSDHYPGSTAQSNPVPGGAGGSMVMKVKNLQQSGTSPETFQAHPGYEIEPYLNSDLLLNLDQVWEYSDLESRILEGLLDMCVASDGHHYVVPIGIHKTNIIIYNIHVFEELGVDIPDHEDITWDEFWAICDALYEAMEEEDEGRYPLDLGDQKGWPATQVFENILMGTDPQIYENFINGIYNYDEVLQVMQTYAKLMDYVADDHNSRDWYNTTGALMNGDYAMQIMGAWVQPLLTKSGAVYGEDFGVFTFPGTAGWFGMCVDGFVVSNGSANVEGGIRWAYNVATPEVQASFATLKEAISPYTDTPDDVYNELTLHFKEQLVSEDIKAYPSITHGTAIPYTASTQLQSQVQEFATSVKHDAEFYTNRIINAMKEAGVNGDWNLVD